MEYSIDFDRENLANSRVNHDSSENLTNGGAASTLYDLHQGDSPSSSSSSFSAGNYALHAAVEHNDVELVALLLRKGADPNLKNRGGLTAKDIATQKLFTDITRLFQRHQEEFLRWCDQGAPDDRDSLGYTKLMKAASANDDKAVTLLLRKGANPNVVSLQNSLTALIIASHRGNAAIVGMLLDKGADVNIKSRQGNNAYEVAQKMGHEAIMNLLKPLTTEFMSKELKALASKSDPKYTLTVRSSIQVRKPTIRIKGQNPYVEVDQTTVEASLNEHLSSLDEFVKWNGPRSGSELDLSKMIDLPSESIMGGQQGSTRGGKGSKGVNLNLSIPQPTAVAPVSGQKSPRGALPSFNQSPSTITPTSAHGLAQSPPPPASPLGYSGVPAVEPHSQATKLFLANVLVIIEKMEEEQQFSRDRQTALNFTFQTVLSYIRQLITAVNNKFNGQFVDITAMIVHEGGEIMREIKDTFQDHDNARKASGGKDDPADFVQKREKISHVVKNLDQQMQNLALKTKMASGIWPPKDSELEMVEAAIQTAKTSRDIINIANLLNIFKTVVDHEEKDREQAGSKRLDFKEYKRQRNMKLLDEIAQVEKSTILTDGDDDDDDGEQKAQDDAFLQDLDASIKVFVTALIKFKTTKEKGEKAEYLTTANGVVEEAASISKKVDAKMGELQSVELDSSIYKLKTTIHSMVLGMGSLSSELLTRVNLSTGVWPPPNAEALMMEAALAMAATVKELVNSSKTTILEYQEIWKNQRRSERKNKKDWEKKLLQNAKIEKFDVLVKEEHTEFVQFEQGEVELTQEEDEFLRDSETDGIVFDKSDDINKPMVKGGVLEKLVERLTYFKYPVIHNPPDGVPAARSKPGMNQAQFTLFMEKKVKPTRLRVFNVFKAWIENHFEDWADNSELISAFRKFVEQKLAVEMKSAAQQLMKLLRDKLDGLKRQSTLTYGENVEMPRPILPKECKGSVDLENFLKHEENRNWMRLDSMELARQLTIIEFAMYEKIQAKECIGQAWNGKKKHVLSPNISNCIMFTNQLSAWVATKILDSEDIRVRLATLKYFVAVGQRCMEMNNFNSATSIHAALESSAVHRLKKTWEQFNTDKKNKQLSLVYESMCTLFSPKGNYSNYRKHLHTINPPVVPYLGVYLTDLTFIEDGNSDFLPAPNNHMINFDKRRKISKSITEIKMYQQIPYFLMDVSQIQDFLLQVQGLDEKMLYKRSLVVEPKEEQPS